MVVKDIFKVFTSLRLTVVCLAVGILLVFFGTLAQVNEGLYNAQDRWFRSFFVWWSPPGANWKIPMFPGGYLVGTVLLLNLIAAHVNRFQLSWKKLGIHIIHGGIIVLLAGQLATDMLSKEMQMSFAEGESRNFSVDPQSSELVFMTDGPSPEQDKIVAVPDGLMKVGKEIRHPELPVTVRVKEWFVNADVAASSETNPPASTAGHGRSVTLIPLPEAKKMDERNLPAAIVELSGPQGSMGTWLLHAKLRDQEIPIGDRIWRMAFRFEREYYTNFSVTLLKTTHEIYRGTGSPGRPDTGIPKNFQSRVRIDNPQRGESREVDIYMNNPLRYDPTPAGGHGFRRRGLRGFVPGLFRLALGRKDLTFYQYQMGRDEMERNRGTSTLQVVRNPSWIAPYVGCVLVGGGMMVQFLSHLVGFIRKRRPL